MSLQLTKCNILKIQARFAIKHLALPQDVSVAVYSAIGNVSMPFSDFYNKTDKEIVTAFISLAMAGMKDMKYKYTREIEKCLRETLI